MSNDALESFETIDPQERRAIRRLREAVCRKCISSLATGNVLSQDDIDLLLGTIVSASDTDKLAAACRDILADPVWTSIATTAAAIERLTNLTVYGIHPVREETPAFSVNDYGFGGPPAATLEESLAWFLQRVPPEFEQVFIDCLDEAQSGLGQRVSSLIPREPFGMIKKLDDRSLQLLIRAIDSRQLATILKGADDESKKKILSNMSQRAGSMLLDDMDAMGALSPASVQAERISLVRLMAKMIESGEIAGPGA